MKEYTQAFVKTLTASDVDPKVSNQHELHGVKKLESIFGVIDRGVDGRRETRASLRVGNRGVPIAVNITWYNARASTPSRHEYRLYYSSESQGIMHKLNAGDDVLIGITHFGEIDIVVFPNQQSGYRDWTQLPA